MDDDLPSNLKQESHFEKASISQRDDALQTESISKFSNRELYQPSEEIEFSRENNNADDTVILSNVTDDLGNVPVTLSIHGTQANIVSPHPTYDSSFSNSSQISHLKREQKSVGKYEYLSENELFPTRNECSDTMNNNETQETLLDNRRLNAFEERSLDQPLCLKRKYDTDDQNEKIQTFTNKSSTDFKSSSVVPGHIIYNKNGTDSNSNVHQILQEESINSRDASSYHLALAQTNVGNTKNIEIQMSPVRIRIAATLGEDSVTHIDQSMEVELDGGDSDQNDPEEPNAEDSETNTASTAVEASNEQTDSLNMSSAGTNVESENTIRSNGIELAAEKVEVEEETKDKTEIHSDVKNDCEKGSAGTSAADKDLKSEDKGASNVPEELEVDEGVDVSEELNPTFGDGNEESEDKKAPDDETIDLEGKTGDAAKDDNSKKDHIEKATEISCINDTKNNTREKDGEKGEECPKEEKQVSDDSQKETNIDALHVQNATAVDSAHEEPSTQDDAEPEDIADVVKVKDGDITEKFQKSNELDDTQVDNLDDILNKLPETSVDESCEVENINDSGSEKTEEFQLEKQEQNEENINSIKEGKILDLGKKGEEDSRILEETDELNTSNEDKETETMLSKTELDTEELADSEDHEAERDDCKYDAEDKIEKTKANETTSLEKDVCAEGEENNTPIETQFEVTTDASVDLKEDDQIDTHSTAIKEQITEDGVELTFSEEKAEKDEEDSVLSKDVEEKEDSGPLKEDLGLIGKESDENVDSPYLKDEGEEQTDLSSPLDKEEKDSAASKNEDGEEEKVDAVTSKVEEREEENVASDASRCEEVGDSMVPKDEAEDEVDSAIAKSEEDVDSAISKDDERESNEDRDEVDVTEEKNAKEDADSNAVKHEEDADSAVPKDEVGEAGSSALEEDDKKVKDSDVPKDDEEEIDSAAPEDAEKGEVDPTALEEDKKEEVDSAPPEDTKKIEVNLTAIEDEEKGETDLTATEDEEKEVDLAAAPEDKEREVDFTASPEDKEKETIDSSVPEEEDKEQLDSSVLKDEGVEEVDSVAPEDEDIELDTTVSKEKDPGEEIDTSIPKSEKSEEDGYKVDLEDLKKEEEEMESHLANDEEVEANISIDLPKKEETEDGESTVQEDMETIQDVDSHISGEEAAADESMQKDQEEEKELDSNAQKPECEDESIHQKEEEEIIDSNLPEDDATIDEINVLPVSKEESDLNDSKLKSIKTVENEDTETPDIETEVEGKNEIQDQKEVLDDETSPDAEESVSPTKERSVTETQIDKNIEEPIEIERADELEAIPTKKEDITLEKNLPVEKIPQTNASDTPKVISPRKGIKVEEDEIETAISSVQFYEEMADANEDQVDTFIGKTKESDLILSAEKDSETEMVENEPAEPSDEICTDKPSDLKEKPLTLTSPEQPIGDKQSIIAEDAVTPSAVSPKKRKKKRKATRSRSTSQKGGVSPAPKKAQDGKGSAPKSGQLDKTASRSGSSSTTRTSSATTDQKKVPPIKAPVGNAPPPKIKQARSKIGSLENVTHKPKGGEKKVEHVKLEWNAKSKVGSLDYATHKPGGGDKKIITQKVDFKNVQSKIGSKDNLKHKPGGGNLKVTTEKLDFKTKATSKVGSLDNAKHKPGGGNVVIKSEKLHFKDKAAPKIISRSGSEKGSSHGGSEIGSPVPPSSPAPPEGMPPLCEDENPSSQDENKSQKEDNVQNQIPCNGGTSDQIHSSLMTSMYESKEDEQGTSPVKENNVLNGEDNLEEHC